MSTLTFANQFSCATDALFRDWGLALSTMFSTLLTKVTTSSDIDWSVVTKPTSAGNYAATFEIYRFNDALHSTHPLFIKIEYGVGGAANAPALRLTIGKSCDGAGMIGGTIIPAIEVLNSSSAITTVRTSYACNGSGSSFCVAFAPNQSSTGAYGAFAIERGVNPDGSYNGEGLFLAYKKTNGTVSLWNSYQASYSLASSNNSLTAGLFPSLYSLSSGDSYANGELTPYFPTACLNPSGLFWIPRVMLGGALVDCSAGAVIANVLEGHTYLGMGNAGTSSDQRNNIYSGTLMLWV